MNWTAEDTSVLIAMAACLCALVVVFHNIRRVIRDRRFMLTISEQSFDTHVAEMKKFVEDARSPLDMRISLLKFSAALMDERASECVVAMLEGTFQRPRLNAVEQTEVKRMEAMRKKLEIENPDLAEAFHGSVKAGLMYCLGRRPRLSLKAVLTASAELARQKDSDAAWVAAGSRDWNNDGSSNLYAHGLVPAS